MVSHPSFVPARRIQFGSKGFGLTPWLCSRGSKRWKRMRRRRQKDRLRRCFALHTRSSWRRCQVILLWWRTFQFDEVYYVQVNFFIKDVVLSYFWDSSWTCAAMQSGKLAMKYFAFLLLSLLDGFPCKSDLKHRHVLDSLVRAAFDVRMCSIRRSFWKVTPQSLRVICIQVMLCARPCLEATMRFQWPMQCVCNPGIKNMLRCVLQWVVKLPSKKSAALQLWWYSTSFMYVILLFMSKV